MDNNNETKEKNENEKLNEENNQILQTTMINNNSSTNTNSNSNSNSNSPSNLKIENLFLLEVDEEPHEFPIFSNLYYDICNKQYISIYENKIDRISLKKERDDINMFTLQLCFYLKFFLII